MPRQACWGEFGDIVIYFNEPVKTSVVPDYYKVIKEPRDLGTIKKQLQRKQYDHPQQFYDVRPSRVRTGQRVPGYSLQTMSVSLRHTFHSTFHSTFHLKLKFP